MKTFTPEGADHQTPCCVMIGIVAVVKNPWVGRGFVEDLTVEIQRMIPVMGENAQG